MRTSRFLGLRGSSSRVLVAACLSVAAAACSSSRSGDEPTTASGTSTASSSSGTSEGTGGSEASGAGGAAANGGSGAGAGGSEGTTTSSSSSSAGSSSSSSGQAAPTTTLKAITANNTSASDDFADVYTPAARFDGSTTPVSNYDAATSTIPLVDMQHGNVSKVSVKTLLYPGATTKVFVETQGWFCTNGKSPIPTAVGSDACGGHVDIGYDSNATAHVDAAVADMVSRGFDGAILDWNGTSAGMGAVNTHTTSVAAISAGNATLMMKAAEATNGTFVFALQEDEGMKDCASTAGCDVTTQVTSDLNFMAANYYTSPAYQTIDGRPVAWFFGVDYAASQNGKTLDWTTIRADAKGNPLFIFETGSGFGHAESDGAYAWLQPTDIGKYPGADPFGFATYVPDFYKDAASHASLHTYGAIYKGFDDLIVNGWGGGQRYIGQQCGKTWLDGFALVNKTFSTSHQLEGLEVPTWDDYEEGSEIETGIESYAAVSASASGSTLSWSVAPTTTGTIPDDCKTAIAGGFSLLSTVHHFDVYASPASDGQSLTLVAGDLPASTKSLDLTGKLGAGAHVLYVQAVSQPSIRNHVSAAVTMP